jgi:hypothetical protein
MTTWYTANLHWISWVFSGIGVLAFGVVGKLGFRQWNREIVPNADRATENIATSVEVANLPNAHRISSFSASEIIAAIASAPPLQRDEVGQSYCGLWVSWKTRFAHGFRSDEEYHLYLREPDERFGRIQTKVHTEKYLELATLGENRRVDVTGRISEASPSRLALSDVELTFPFEDPKVTPQLLIDTPPANLPLREAHIGVLLTLAAHKLDDPGDKICLLAPTKWNKSGPRAFQHLARSLSEKSLVLIRRHPRTKKSCYRISPLGEAWLFKRHLYPHRPASHYRSLDEDGA